MVIIWLIYGYFVVDHGFFMVYIWLIYSLDMVNMWLLWLIEVNLWLMMVNDDG